jgi:Family of unknown function (DUF6166)
MNILFFGWKEQYQNPVYYTVEGAPAVRLDLRADLVGHSIEFSWGYGGSGPGQLALAILAVVCPTTDEAVEAHQAFKWAVIARLDRHTGWCLHSDQVEAWLDSWRLDRQERRRASQGREPSPDLE